MGRDRELEEIRSALRAIAQGAGGIRSIMGEAGLGKSRLVAEELQFVAGSIKWAEGRALSHAAGMSYWMARDLLYDLLKVKPDAPPAKIEMALRKSVAEVAAGKINEIYPYLGRLSTTL